MWQALRVAAHDCGPRLDARGREPNVSGRSFRQLVLASLVIGAFAAAALGVSGGLAARSDDVADLSAQLAQCKKDLAEARAAVATADQYQALIADRKIVLIPYADTLVPVRIDEATKALILQYVSGKISSAELSKLLRHLVNRAKFTGTLIRELAADSRAERDKIDARCSDLAGKLKAAQAGGQSTTTGQAGAFPGGTATRLTLKFQGSTVVTDLKSNAQSPDHQAATVHLQSGQSFGGSVSLDGTLPPGWTVVVFHPVPSAIELNSHDGGDFQGITQPKGFGSSTTLAAYVCKRLPVQTGNCSAQADIDISWTP